MINLFDERPRTDPSVAAQIKRWVAEAAGLDSATTVMVTELRCTEPGCPPLETVIALMLPGGARQYRLHKAAADVGRDDVDRLLRHGHP